MGTSPFIAESSAGGVGCADPVDEAPAIDGVVLEAAVRGGSDCVEPVSTGDIFAADASRVPVQAASGANARIEKRISFIGREMGTAMPSYICGECALTLEL